ncbi:MAG: hypothetical protein WCM93_08405 [Bacteroidota bacterium]
MNAVDFNNDYRSFSEIDYLLGSNLAETPLGLSKAMQRLPLFDLSKRHIPYLLLIHKVFYNIDFPEADKKEAINKMLAGLYRDVIHKNSRKQLTDFFPSYFVYRLLLDLHIAGYKSNQFIRGLKDKPEDETEPISELLKYGDYSDKGFPQSLWMSVEKYKHLGKFHDKLFSLIAVLSLYADNFNGFYNLLGYIKDGGVKAFCLLDAVVFHVFRNETDQALKIAESEQKIDWKSVYYMNMGIALSETGKIDLLNDLRLTNTAPELQIGIICGMLNYHSFRNEISIVDSLLNEAFVILHQIKDTFIRVARLLWFIGFLHKTGKTAKFESCIKEILRLEQQFNKEKKDIIRRNFCSRLFRIGLIDLAKEFAQKWHFPDNGKTEFGSHYNTDFFFQAMVEEELDICDFTIHCDRLLPTINKAASAEYYFKSTLEIAAAIQEDMYRDSSLQRIAGRMAKHGFYNEAIRIRDSIKTTAYQSQIDSSIPMYAIANGDVAEALLYVEIIADEKTRLAVQLCMAPHLEKLKYTVVAAKFIREWANYIFQNI